MQGGDRPLRPRQALAIRPGNVSFDLFIPRSNPRGARWKRHCSPDSPASSMRPVGRHLTLSGAAVGGAARLLMRFQTKLATPNPKTLSSPLAQPRPSTAAADGAGFGPS
jgi:hypothetical protein